MKIEITINIDDETKALLRNLLLSGCKTATVETKTAPEITYYVKEWADENLKVAKGKQITASDAFEHYLNWCDCKGIAWPASQKKFGHEMTKTGAERCKIAGTTRYLNTDFVA